jgi:hypothetical protein
VIALLSMVLLASLVFYVFNVGHHVANRVEVQNAADNAAISGAGWVARSFNTVAMNNVEQSRLIALAGVMDALPQAVDYTLTDQIMLLDAVNQQSARGVGTDDWVNDGLAVARDTFQRHIELLQPMDELLNESGYDIASMTFFNGPGGQRGDLWEAFESLGALSEATMLELGLQAQHSAFRGAQISQREGGLSAGGLLLPWVPDVPWTVGAFEDFRAPTIDGLLPDDQDDKAINRGPFDTVFGHWQFRSDANRRSLDITVEQDFVHTSWAPNPPTEEVISREVTGYSTWGAFTDMRQNAMSLGVGSAGVFSRFQQASDDPSEIARHPLVPSLWARRVAFLSDYKINQAFPGAAAERIVREPVWISRYDDAEAILEAGEPRINYALYLLFTFVRDEFPGVPPGRPVLDSWALLRPESNELNPPGLLKVADHIWRDDRVEAYSDVFGQAYQRRYIRYYVFMGVNIGPEATVRNPYNFDSEARNNLPGPINFTVDEFEPTEDNRRRDLTFLGIAHQPKEAPFWSPAFDDDRADDQLVGLAQAEVFNNHSWDLWTQMWQAQLVPIDAMDQWLDDLAEPEALDEQDWQDVDDVEAVTRYLQAVQPLADLMLEH